MYYYWYGQGLIWPLLAVIIAIIVGLFVYFSFINNYGRNYQGFLKKIKDFFDFKTIIIESILKILYIITTIFIILISFSFIEKNLLIFLVIILFGNLLLRLIYEGILMIIMIWKNTKEINTNTKK